MTTDRDLLAISTAAFLGLTRVQRNMLDILTAMTVTDIDGYPTSTIGAAPATPGPPIVYEGRCKEPIDVTKDGKIICSHPRPCPDHDGPVAMTSVEQAAIHQKENAARRETEILLRRIATDVGNLQQVTKPYLPKIEPPTRCNAGAGRRDQHVWGNPTCEQIPDERCFGMCLDCFGKLNAHELEHGLPVTQRSAPSYLTERNVRRGDRGRFTAA